MDPDISQRKAELRSRLKRVLANIAPEEWTAASANFAPRLLDVVALAKAKTILFYAPVARELDVGPVGKACLEKGLRVAIPRSGWHDQSITPVEVTEWPFGEKLSPGKHGIHQPAENARVLNLGEIDLVVVPGLGFDATGGRLGRGGGFYDRFLTRPELRAWRVGAAMDEQVVEEVPRDRWDVGMDVLVTPLRTLVFSARAGGTG